MNSMALANCLDRIRQQLLSQVVQMQASRIPYEITKFTQKSEQLSDRAMTFLSAARDARNTHHRRTGKFLGVSATSMEARIVHFLCHLASYNFSLWTDANKHPIYDEPKVQKLLGNALGSLGWLGRLLPNGDTREFADELMTCVPELVVSLNRHCDAAKVSRSTIIGVARLLTARYHRNGAIVPRCAEVQQSLLNQAVIGFGHALERWNDEGAESVRVRLPSQLLVGVCRSFCFGFQQQLLHSSSVLRRMNAWFVSSDRALACNTSSVNLGSLAVGIAALTTVMEATRALLAFTIVAVVPFDEKHPRWQPRAHKPKYALCYSVLHLLANATFALLRASADATDERARHHSYAPDDVRRFFLLANRDKRRTHHNALDDDPALSVLSQPECLQSLYNCCRYTVTRCGFDMPSPSIIDPRANQHSHLLNWFQRRPASAPRRESFAIASRMIIDCTMLLRLCRNNITRLCQLRFYMVVTLCALATRFSELVVSRFPLKAALQQLVSLRTLTGTSYTTCALVLPAMTRVHVCLPSAENAQSLTAVALGVVLNVLVQLRKHPPLLAEVAPLGAFMQRTVFPLLHKTVEHHREDGSENHFAPDVSALRNFAHCLVVAVSQRQRRSTIACESPGEGEGWRGTAVEDGSWPSLTIDERLMMQRGGWAIRNLLAHLTK